MDNPENETSTNARWPLGLNIASVLVVVVILGIVAGAFGGVIHPKEVSAPDCAAGTNYVETIRFDILLKIMVADSSCEPQ